MGAGEFGRSAALHVRRAKGGKASVHPIRGYELRMLTALRKAFPDNGYVFTTERRTPFTTDAINRPIKNVGNRAELPLPVHFHMLRHSCSCNLANDGIDTRAIQDWLGHVSITHTPRYAQLSPARLKDFWRQAANTMTAVLGPGPPLSPTGPSPSGPVSRIHRRSRLRPDAICRARDELWRHPNVQNETIAIFWRRNLDTVLIREHYNRTLPEGDSLCVRLVKR
jgi:hypothetical protein